MAVWKVTWKANPALVALADRHYSRRYPGTPLFTPPGETVALISEDQKAGWVTLRQGYGPLAGEWVNCFFRNENRELLSSSLIREAIVLTIAEWGPLPPTGILTFIDRTKVRYKRDFGRCYLKAGFKPDGFSSKGLLRLRYAL